MEQVKDFLDESYQLLKSLADIKPKNYYIKTQFKNWSINDVLGHLHIFNNAANVALNSDSEFQKFFTPIESALKNGYSLIEAQKPWLKDLTGLQLLNAWWDGCETVAQTYRNTDPKKRIKWVGPEMSARSSITARQMETWAHGQEIFDVLGVIRSEGDRIKNIAHMGVSTFEWTFKNRNLEVPLEKPFVKLKAPSGRVWEWNDLNSQSSVMGKAVDFASVVTQTRNVKDTEITTRGCSAKVWMKFAQCFAGPPSNPPSPGSRFLKSI